MTKKAPMSTAVAKAKRRFEFSDGSSNKFWEIEVHGEGFTTRHGKIGTAGTEVAKTFDSADEAQKGAGKLVGEKLKKGYSEVGAGEPVS